jgi:hypothetical protein
MLGDDRSPHRFQGRADPIRTARRRTAALCASLNRRRPSVGACCFRMPDEVEDVHHAFPNGLALEDLADRYGLGERGAAAVHALDRRFQLTFGRVSRRSHYVTSLRLSKYSTRSCTLVLGLSDPVFIFSLSSLLAFCSAVGSFGDSSSNIVL